MSTTNNSINSPIPTTVANGGSGRASGTTAYAPICVGTTATGAQQTASTGLSSSGYVLTSTGASSLPTFQTVGASGSGLVLIAAATPSSAASVQFNNNLTSTYNQYLLVYSLFLGSTSLLYINYGYGGTPTYSTSGYTGQVFYGITGSTVVASTIIL